MCEGDDVFGGGCGESCHLGADGGGRSVAALELKNLKRQKIPCKNPDSGGISIQVTSAGGMLWLYRYPLTSHLY